MPASPHIVVIGAGIVGLATALKLLETKPGMKVTVLEKEGRVAQHQTGHNSGVIHSGIYYKPGSLKAINCKQGYALLLAFCDKHSVPYDICGKVIVATQEKEVASLENIYQRGIQNGLTGIRKITQAEIKEREPYCAGMAGVWVPQTGIVNYKTVAEKYAELIRQQGGEIRLGEQVTNIHQSSAEVVTETTQGTHHADVVVNCAGLYSDKIARLTSPQVDLQIIPFRGEYYEIKPERQYLVKNLIYPVPNPEFPFLGVHFTRMAGGGIEAGPNAVFAFRREGYTNRDVHFGELWEALSFSGFHKIAIKYWRDGLYEMYRSYSKAAFVRALQVLIPDIKGEDIVPGGAGVRAQACDAKGNLIDDFLIMENKKVLNICNAPSPAATASLAIGANIAERALQKI